MSRTGAWPHRITPGFLGGQGGRWCGPCTPFGMNDQESRAKAAPPDAGASRGAHTLPGDVAPLEPPRTEEPARQRARWFVPAVVLVCVVMVAWALSGVGIISDW